MCMRQKPSKIIKSLRKNGCNIKVTAKELGIHPTTVYRWKKRSCANGRHLVFRGLKRKSTRPKNIKYALNKEEELKIITLRNERGVTAEKIKYQLKLKVSHRTVHRFLKRINSVRKYGYHRRPRFQNTFHMHLSNTKTIGYLQMDVKVVTPELSGLPWTCFEYAVIDIFSRYKEAVILNQLDQDGSIVALLEILPKLPFKSIFIQTDNGLEFGKRFDDFCVAQGLKHHYIHKRTPNENAIIERSFRTDEEEFYFRIKKRPKHYDELRDLLAEFLQYYNHERIHLGINFKTPYQIVAEVVSD